MLPQSAVFSLKFGAVYMCANLVDLDKCGTNECVNSEDTKVSAKRHSATFGDTRRRSIQPRSGSRKLAYRDRRASAYSKTAGAAGPPRCAAHAFGPCKSLRSVFCGASLKYKIHARRSLRANMWHTREHALSANQTCVSCKTRA